MYMIRKISTLRIYKGGLGGYPPRSRSNFKKSSKMEAFPLFFFFFFFFAFWQGSLDPKNYELAPQHP